jgi:two-component system, NtrC family, sensor histidine kinase HydH
MMQPEPLEDPYLELAELAGGFIHEIKNHLNTLSLNAQLLAEELDPPESLRERRALDRIGRLNFECHRLVELSNDFLRFARVDRPTTTLYSLDQIVSRTENRNCLAR